MIPCSAKCDPLQTLPCCPAHVDLSLQTLILVQVPKCSPHESEQLAIAELGKSQEAICHRRQLSLLSDVLRTHRGTIDFLAMILYRWETD
jgi:hypothetical protein